MIRARADRLPLADGSVALIITSPPYWGRWCYGDHPDEIGREDLDVYLDRMATVGAELARVLAPDGVLWLNIGDTSASSGGAGGDYRINGTRSGQKVYRQGAAARYIAEAAPDGSAAQAGGVALGRRKIIRRCSWCMVPFRVFDRLEADGWLIRSVVTWDKRRHRREDLTHAGRPGEQTEQIAMLTRSMDYKPARWRPERMTEQGDVWSFSPSSGKRTRRVPTYPQELVRRCLEPIELAPGEVVLDPFAGNGTTGSVVRDTRPDVVTVECDIYAGEIEDDQHHAPAELRRRTLTLTELADIGIRHAVYSFAVRLMADGLDDDQIIDRLRAHRTKLDAEQLAWIRDRARTAS